MMLYINQRENHVSAYFDFIVIHMNTWPHGSFIVSFLYFIMKEVKCFYNPFTNDFTFYNYGPFHRCLSPEAFLVSFCVLPQV